MPDKDYEAPRIEVVGLIADLTMDDDGYGKGDDDDDDG